MVLKENIDFEGKSKKINGLKIFIGRWIGVSGIGFNKGIRCLRKWEGRKCLFFILGGSEEYDE